jgi:hypothetical protein
MISRHVLLCSIVSLVVVELRGDRLMKMRQGLRASMPRNFPCHPERNELASEVEGSQATVHVSVRSLASSG